jgi:hypothetical protein
MFCRLLKANVLLLLSVKLTKLNTTGLTIATNKIKAAKINKCGKYKKINSPNCETTFQSVV